MEPNQSATEPLNAGSDTPKRVLEAASLSNYASFGDRATALFVDIVVLGLLVVLLTWLGVIESGAGPATRSDAYGRVGLSINFRLPHILLFLVYFAGFEGSALQATPGKLLAGVKVTTVAGKRISWGRAIGRYFAKFLSFISLGIGFLLVIFDEDRRSLHDRVADTRVLKR